MRKKRDAIFLTPRFKELALRYAISLVLFALTSVGCGLYVHESGPVQPKKLPLYERLGADVGITKIVDDFVGIVSTDDRVNFTRKGVPGAEWNASDENVKHLKEQLVAYITKAVGGPNKYQGKSMHDVHRNMQITDGEFDAAIKDLKLALDRNRIPADAQRELLEIVEKTEGDIVTKK